MQVQINYKSQNNYALSFLLEKLPKDLNEKLTVFINENKLNLINEIRIKAFSHIVLIANSKNIKTDIFTTQDMITEIFYSLCNGSLYAHTATIRQGYISVGKGLRAGICGRAVAENGAVSEICDISSINIRIPNQIAYAGEYLFNLIKNESFERSILIYSPPGVGKTTILRDFIVRLSNNETPIRHSVIDSREEITPFMDNNLSSDVFIGYPKGQAIEMATRTMTPQLIICDEIASTEEAESVLKACNSGVKLIATTHASNFDELLKKEITKKLIEHNVFDFALGVRRKQGESKYTYYLDKFK